MQHFTDSPVTPLAPRVPPEALEGCAVVCLAIAEMECPDCANRIRNALLAHPGILEAEMDARAALAHVWHDPARVGVSEILSIVTVLGEGTQHRFLAVELDCSDRR
jgi:copper chaperone CopZ